MNKRSERTRAKQYLLDITELLHSGTAAVGARTRPINNQVSLHSRMEGEEVYKPQPLIIEELWTASEG